MAVTLACALAVAPASAATAGDKGSASPAKAHRAQVLRTVAELQSSVISAGGGVASTAATVREVLAGYAATMKKLAAARDEAAAARRRAVQAAADVAAQQSSIDELVRASYMAGGSVSTLAAVLSGEGPTDILDRATLLNSVTDAQLAMLERYVATRQRMVEERDRAAAAEAEVEEVAAGAEGARRSALVAAAAQQEAMAALTRRLAKVAGRLDADASAASGRARQQALAVVAAQDAYRLQLTAQMTDALAEFAAVTPHATARQGRVALRWAHSQLGVPYSWGGGDEDGPTLGVAGPGKHQKAGLRTVGFDCSGLVTFAWAKAGVHLDSYTGFQWVEGRHVALDRLRPGDLVFFAKDVGDPATIHHVGIYSGNGWMIDAPHTGAVVRYDTVFRPGLIGAVRP